MCYTEGFNVFAFNIETEAASIFSLMMKLFSLKGLVHHFPKLQAMHLKNETLCFRHRKAFALLYGATEGRRGQFSDFVQKHSSGLQVLK